MTTEQKKPRAILIHRESELGNLVEGDSVKVSLYTSMKPEWMAFAGRAGEGSSLRYSFVRKPDDISLRIAFLKHPAAEIKDLKPELMMWGSYVRYLQFPGEHIHFDSFHKNLNVVEPSSPDYQRLKILADLLH